MLRLPRYYKRQEGQIYNHGSKNSKVSFSRTPDIASNENRQLYEDYSLSLITSQLYSGADCGPLQNYTV